MNSENKKYSKYSEILQRLKNEVKVCMVMGIPYLPGERELAEKLATSRNTLRKALQCLEAEGRIICEGHRKRIVQVFRNLADLGTIVFLAEGSGQLFKLPAVERLWHSLSPLLLHRRARLMLCLAASPNHSEQVREILQQATVIISAAPPQSTRMFLNTLKDKIIIETIDVSGTPVPNVVMLDNHAVGRLAAETLLNQGCAKIFAMWEICPGNAAMPSRAQGFAEVLQERHLGGIESVVWIKRVNNSVIDEMKQQLAWSIAHDYDGVFLMSDESIGDVLGEQIRLGTIPSRMRVITTDGTGAGRRHHPSVTSVSHATESVALEIY